MWGRTSDAKPPLSSPEPPAPPAPVAAVRPAPMPTPESRPAKTLLGQGLAVKGELSGKEDVTIDGQFEGQIQVSGAGITIGANGRVSAEVEADEIVIEGKFEGSLRARQRIVIRRTAQVTGEIEVQRLLIEEGATFRGRVSMMLPGEERARAATAASAARPTIARVPVEASESVS
jgi:cytoskeletal protein CcmA (bactofilin family)